MNLGMVIGVTEYDGSLGRLPACRRDAQAMAAILRGDSRFDDVLVISEDTKSRSVKAQVTDFVSRHHGEKIEDVVFYFSGHGDFADGEFFYLLSDFDPKRRQLTSFENAEIDALLRSLCPEVAVKFVDACHSGITYVKDPDAFKTYLKGSGETFKKCYFSFSSQADQSSYQDKHLSYFTRALVESVVQHDIESLRYKDVIDFISDAFSSDTGQTPFFVTQADFTEIFCTVSTKLVESVRAELANDDVEAQPSPLKCDKTLIERVKDDAQRYCDKTEATNLLNRMYDEIASLGPEDEASKLFEISTSKIDDVGRGLLGCKEIGVWLTSNPGQYFAKPSYKTVKVRKRVPKRISTFISIADDDYKYVETEEERVDGFEPTAEIPFIAIIRKAEPLFPNLSACQCILIPVISRTTLQLFAMFARFRESGWAARTP